MKTGTPEWLDARRELITSTDIPAILGISPWKSEGDVARSKTGTEIEPEPNPRRDRRMRLGLAMEDIVAGEDEREHGFALTHVDDFIVSEQLPWAGTSLDYERVAEKVIVEIKTTSARDWADGLPEHVEAQVRWQMGVAGYPKAHIAALRFGSDLDCYDITHDPATFDGLVAIATDFRRRLVEGGPFRESRNSMRRAWPDDDGTAEPADDETIAAVAELLRTRAAQESLNEREEALIVAIQTRMGPAALLTGPGWRVSWKRSKDATYTDWKSVAQGLLRTLTDEEGATLTSIHTIHKAGSRPFVVRKERE